MEGFFFGGGVLFKEPFVSVLLSVNYSVTDVMFLCAGIHPLVLLTG
jgi:hypothetical protein